MPFLENLVEGLDRAAGATGAVGDIEKKKADRVATEHEKLHGETQSILNDVQGLQQRRMALDPSSPTYAKDVGEIDQNLHDARQAFTDLYHPEKNPGALQHLSGFLKQHLLRRPAPPTTPGQARQSFAQIMAPIDAAAAAPGAGLSAEDRLLTPDQRRHKALVNAGLEPRAIEVKPETQNWIPTTVKLADGREITLQRNSKSGAWTDLAGNPVPKEQLSGATVAPKAVGKAVRAWVKRNGKTVSVLLDPATNKPIPGSENPDIVPPASMSGRITTGFYHFIDDQGNVHQIQETHTSMPAGAGSVAKTPGEAKDKILGRKATTSENNDIKVADALETDARLADSRLADRTPPGDTGIVMSWVRAQVRGAGRMTNVEIEQGLKSGSFGERASNAYNRALNGTLDDNFIKNMVGDIHKAAKAARETADKYKQPAASTTTAASPSASPAVKPTGKTVSLAAAKKLQQNAGKTDDEIRQDIEAHGYKAVD